MNKLEACRVFCDKLWFKSHRVHFPHTPVILTASETRELQALLNRWLLNRWDETNATPDRRIAGDEEGAEP